MGSPIQTEISRLNLSSDELDLIKEILQREPNELELEIFSLMWSEHACYKNSLKWLKTLPRTGDNVLVQAGKESAGAIDIGDGLACVVKIESHNHPCAIQPRLGASTGMRVVTRDVMAMGAKPVALLDSLRFGDGERDTARWLFQEVIKGVSEFEKNFGTPVIGGEVYFDKGYNSNPIVNNMAVGVINKDELVSGVAAGEGNKIAVLGASTGRDGIDEDTFSADMVTKMETKKISIDQMMDVSVENNLLKAIRQLVEQQNVIGIHTIGAQGIVGAAAEMASRGESGIRLMVEDVPLREDNMNLREILFAETWGRILVCFSPDQEAAIRQIAKVSKVGFGVIGTVTNSGMLTCINGKDVIAEIPASYVGLGGNAPVYEREMAVSEQKCPPVNFNEESEPDHYPDVVKTMMNSLNVSSKEWLSKAFNRSIHTESVSHKFPSDAAFVEIEGNKKALAITMDCNPNYMKADPNMGAQIAVAEAARNIVCAGGKPVCVSDCLNFGNPYEPKVYGQFVMAVKGIDEACRFYGTPVLSGNVSFYNQRSEEGRVKSVVPAPVIGMVGVVDDKKTHTTLSFRRKGDMIFLVGKSVNDVNSSEYAINYLGIEKSAVPYYNAEEEKEIHETVTGLIKAGLVRSVHDVSNGGLFFNLLESAIPLEFGFDITSDAEIRKDAFLFGESQGRVVVSVAPEKQDDFVDFMIDCEVPFSILGHVTKGEIRVDDESYGFVGDLKKKFESRIKKWLGEKL
ncbi:phosphoribosylformylglycinamidine synthase subunit PurL [Marinilabiliaceae bacterium JC017]|nr:phosphoribosylformylglycinamidine synthase subunit PurL [Marinilabiliaceae bacterium JC017]